MNKELISPLVQSLVRFLAAFAAGWAGVEIKQGDLDSTVGVISIIAIGAGSLAWSHFNQKKLLSTTPEK